MRFSEAWLREWVNPDISTSELVDQLSMAGLEVDGVEPAAPVFSGVVVGKVLSREQHPDADKLSVCQVDIGAGETSQIVCGARNVAAGMKVPVATVGATLPGDFKIKRAKLRGVESLGMICSAAELGLAESSDGIMPLSDKAEIGRDFRELLDLDDPCIELDLTPDRGDCLCIRGIAKDVGVIWKSPLTLPKVNPIRPSNTSKISVFVSATAECPRYSCRVIKGIDPSAETPSWMQEKLRRSGLRPISPVVDVTNYVMLELGQPMHGFDLDKLDGAIEVRLATSGEKLTLLDGSEVVLKEKALLISDQSKPLALAGIMGGEDSGVTEKTRNILLESAYFSPTAIIGKARAYGLHTDSSHRFERGVDHQLQVMALERATKLLLDIVGGEAGPVVEEVSQQNLPGSKMIRLRYGQIPRLLGVDIDKSEIEDMLVRLGMTIEPATDGWNVVPPSARFDIAIEADLIEEIGRIYGYANIPENLSSAPVSIVAEEECSFNLSHARRLLVNRGYQEVITYSFISPELAELISPEEQTIKLTNPISAEMSIMRGSLWPGLLTTLQYNLARQQDRVRLFESGLRFQNKGEIEQQPMLAGLIYGPFLPEQWGERARKVDFYDLKGDVEELLALLDWDQEILFTQVQDPALHPGQSARILRGGLEIGRLGVLHPAIQKKLNINDNVLLFEVNINSLRAGNLPSFSPLSKFPAIRRDIALLVDRDLPFAEIEACARRAAPQIIKDIRLFDVYTGDNVDSSVKSLALSLILQDYSNTLTDADVEKATNKLLTALESELSAKLRD